MPINSAFVRRHRSKSRDDLGGLFIQKDHTNSIVKMVKVTIQVGPGEIADIFCFGLMLASCGFRGS